MKRSTLILAALLCACVLSACEQEPYPLAPPATMGRVTELYNTDARYWVPRWFTAWGSDGDHFFVGGRDTVYTFDRDRWDRTALTDCSCDVNELWGTSPDCVFAANDAGLFRYDGTNWEDLGMWAYHVYGFAPDDVFATTRHLLLHYDGRELAEVASIPYGRLTGLWGTSASDLYLVDENRVHRYDGDTLSVLLEAEADLIEIWGTSADDIYVTGQAGAMYHYNGRQWEHYLLETYDDVTRVWGSGPDDVYAVAGFDLFHFDGNWWSRSDTEFSVFMIDGWGSAGAGQVLVGINGVLREDASGWRSVVLGNEPAHVGAVWPLARNEIVVTSDAISPVTHRTRGSRIHHFVSGQWEELPSSPAPLQEVWGNTVSDMYAVSPFGFGWHFDGTGWTNMADSKTHEAQFDLWSPGGSQAVACGFVIDVFDGVEWTTHRNPAGEPLLAVSGSDMKNVAFVGELNTVVRCVDGDTTVVRFDGMRLKDVWVGDRSHVIVVGATTDLPARGVVLRFDGRDWRHVPYADDWDAPESINGVSSDEVYIVSVTGTMYVFDGDYVFPFDGRVPPASRLSVAADGTVFDSDTRGIRYIAK